MTDKNNLKEKGGGSSHLLNPPSNQYTPRSIPRNSEQQQETIGNGLTEIKTTEAPFMQRTMSNSDRRQTQGASYLESQI